MSHCNRSKYMPFVLKLQNLSVAHYLQFGSTVIFAFPTFQIRCAPYDLPSSSAHHLILQRNNKFMPKIFSLLIKVDLSKPLVVDKVKI